LTQTKPTKELICLFTPLAFEWRAIIIINLRTQCHLFAQRSCFCLAVSQWATKAAMNPQHQQQLTAKVTGPVGKDF